MTEPKFTAQGIIQPLKFLLGSPDLKVTFFSYMYFTSQTWSLVGCLVAGFGVYPLMEPCITASHLAASLEG